jgi:hypothetical protein
MFCVLMFCVLMFCVLMFCVLTPAGELSNLEWSYECI